MLADSSGILQFETPDIQNTSALEQYVSTIPDVCSYEASRVTLLLWHGMYGHRICTRDGLFFIRIGWHKPRFFLPLGQDLEKGISLLRAYTREQGIPLCLMAAQSARLDAFRALYENEFSFTPSRDDFEYIYTTEQLTTLSGKKLHAKRNHIADFSRRYRWSYEPITKAVLPEVFALADRWKAEAEKIGGASKSMEVENAAMKQLLPQMDTLHIRGGLIRVDGSAVAFCFGSPISGDVFDVHVEKALPAFREAYTVINQQFAQHALSGFTYINREDDMGLPGLRKAKLSYNPSTLLEKYIICEK